MFSVGLCGHFALDILLEILLNKSIFETNVPEQNITKNIQMSDLTPITKIVSGLNMICYSFTQMYTSFNICY